MQKILEAIQRGLQMGLEIQDNEPDQTTFQKPSISSNYHTGRADQIRWVRDNFVDLGLPSGTLWCKWNLGATCEDTPESWYGNYYAWGEAEPKENYQLEAYKHYNGYSESYTKYNGNDNKLMLDHEDDTVSVTLGKGFRMPSKEDVIELCSLPNKWVYNHNGINGLNGRVFIGNNGNKLFIPAAGYRGEEHTYYSSHYCRLWSNSFNFAFPNYADCMFFYSDDISPFGKYRRCYGLSVRAVI